RHEREKKPVDSDTIFPIGALSQGFTAACVAQQVYRKGGFSYDNKMSDFLPHLHTSDATVGDLLGHRTGLQTSDHWPQMSSAGDFDYSVINDKTVIPIYKNLGPRATLRSQFPYNGIGYALFGKIVSPKYPDYVKEKVLKPRQMSRTQVALTETSDKAKNTSRRYSVGVNGRLFAHGQHGGYSARIHNTMPSVAVGSMMSTTNDLAKYCIALNQAWKRQRHTKDAETQTPRRKQVFPDVDLLFNPLQAMGADETANKSHAAGLGDLHATRCHWRYWSQPGVDEDARQKYYELAEKLQQVQGRQTNGPERSLRHYRGRYKSAVSGLTIDIEKRSFFSRHLGKDERDEDEGGLGRKKSPLEVNFRGTWLPLLLLHHHHGDAFTWFPSWNQLAEREFPFVHDAQYYTIQFQPTKSGIAIESLTWFNDSAKQEGEVFARIWPPIIDY
ncbi:beta-lactamase/transpeptidase-like protein, partial [Trichoderma compactum]